MLFWRYSYVVREKTGDKVTEIYYSTDPGAWRWASLGPFESYKSIRKRSVAIRTKAESGGLWADFVGNVAASLGRYATEKDVKVVEEGAKLETTTRDLSKTHDANAERPRSGLDEEAELGKDFGRDPVSAPGEHGLGEDARKAGDVAAQAGTTVKATGEAAERNAEIVLAVKVLVEVGAVGVAAIVAGPQATELPDLEQLGKAAAQADKNGLTKAGRALQKHAARPGSAYSAASQRPDVLNAEGQAIVNDILTTPGSRIVQKMVIQNGQSIKVMDVVAPDGRIIRYNSDGTQFIGFREPPKAP